MNARKRRSLCLVSLCSVTGVTLSIELDLLSECEKETFFVSGKSVLCVQATVCSVKCFHKYVRYKIHNSYS